MKIGFVTTDWSDVKDDNDEPTPGGAGWYRIALPARTLKSHGIDAVLGPRLMALPSGEMVIHTWDEEVHQGFDLIVIQRWMDEVGATAISRARATGQVIVNDVDDWFEGLDTSNVAFRTTHPRVNRERNRNFYAANLAASSALTVSTPYLQKRYQEKYPRVPVHLIRNAIDLGRWSMQDCSDEDITLGWVGATMFRSKDLETVASSVRQFLHSHKNARFQQGGWAAAYPSAAEVMKLPNSIPSGVIPIDSIERYPRLFTGLNIGIVPLSSSTFNLAKSGIKGMEYAASGVPFVAQATPEYEWLANIKGIGRTADRARDWNRQLTALANPEIRVAEALRNHRNVAQLDIADRWVDWVSTYTRMLGGAPDIALKV